MGTPARPEVYPVAVRVHLSHAAIEVWPCDAGVDLLHIKGPALLPGLRLPGREHRRRRAWSPRARALLERPSRGTAGTGAPTYDTGSAFRTRATGSTATGATSTSHALARPAAAPPRCT